ncbi:unnamed protein product [Pedinophyceae sp. YPF-701]|nr:unnamed protein product [Pedinophyceae sp. YPF-701]
MSLVSSMLNVGKRCLPRKTRRAAGEESARDERAAPAEGEEQGPGSGSGAAERAGPTRKSSDLEQWEQGAEVEVCGGLMSRPVPGAILQSASDGSRAERSMLGPVSGTTGTTPTQSAGRSVLAGRVGQVLGELIFEGTTQTNEAKELEVGSATGGDDKGGPAVDPRDRECVEAFMKSYMAAIQANDNKWANSVSSTLFEENISMVTHDNAKWAGRMNVVRRLNLAIDNAKTLRDRAGNMTEEEARQMVHVDGPTPVRGGKWEVVMTLRRGIARFRMKTVLRTRGGKIFRIRQTRE